LRIVIIIYLIIPFLSIFKRYILNLRHLKKLFVQGENIFILAVIGHFIKETLKNISKMHDQEPTAYKNWKYINSWQLWVKNYNLK
jgi:hypothetical protein